MAKSAIAVDAIQSLHVRSDLPPQITFDDDSRAIDDMSNLSKLIVCQFSSPRVGVDPSLDEHFLGGGSTHSIDIGERRFDALLIGDFNS